MSFTLASEAYHISIVKWSGMMMIVTPLQNYKSYNYNKINYWHTLQENAPM